ncbi:MAG: ABC transporter ATP-binding protein [Sphaerospermopsis sp. SIO1G2]|nr:ABC transporter ATP-binding protein [Sphaerospermopsis sp. SIO1G2]
MSDTVIKVENLGKKYIIGHQSKERYTALRDVLANQIKSLGNLVNPKAKYKNPNLEDFWALKDISFDIKQGDRVGIIGRNGAGKSTLLKILSRITEPTKGRIYLKGRIASLLEVGTGFHPELTGRENIFLNGAILGMSNAEIKRKFDEIVDFSEVKKFLDTPVKRYSSGMYVRLAFAVAAHLEPEILVVDEVLAVGDAAFQKKCLGKMEDVGKEGRTVLFVSHQMAAIQNLCSKAILLNQGKIIQLGNTIDVIDTYLQNSASMEEIPLYQRIDRQGTGEIKFTSFSLLNDDGVCVQSFYSGQTSKLELYFDNYTNNRLKNLHISLGVDNWAGERIAYFSNDLIGNTFSDLPATASKIELCIPKLPLTPGRYGFTIFCEHNGIIADWIKNAGVFYVESGDYYSTGKLPPENQGYFLIDYQFHAE